MVSKYENLTNDEIILQYKINKEIERARNREAYERLKLNKVKYRQRLNNAYNKQVERINNIKADENKYNEWLINNKIIQSKSYYKKVENVFGYNYPFHCHKGHYFFQCQHYYISDLNSIVLPLFHTKTDMFFPFLKKYLT